MYEEEKKKKTSKGAGYKADDAKKAAAAAAPATKKEPEKKKEAEKKPNDTATMTEDQLKALVQKLLGSAYPTLRTLLLEPAQVAPPTPSLPTLPPFLSPLLL